MAEDTSTMNRPAVFFDRDNTLIVSDGYLGDPAKVELIEGAAEAVARVRSLGYAAVVFSNQSGVARGLFGEEAVHAVNARLDEMLHDQNPAAVIDRHEFCPFHPDGTVEMYREDSDLRKPRPGMIRQAAQALGLDLSRSWVVGDAPRDIEAGRAAGCRTVLVRNPHLAASPAAGAAPAVEPDVVVDTIADAVDVIARATAARVEAERTTEAPVAAPESDSPTPSVGAVREDASVPSAGATALAVAVDNARSQLRSDQASVAGADYGRRDLVADAPGTAVPETNDATVEEGAAAVGSAKPQAAEALLATAAAPVPQPATLDYAAPAPIHTPAPPGRSAKRSGDALDALNRIQATAEQILQEMRRRNELLAEGEFSVTKLLAGVVQVIALAALFIAYMRWDDFQARLSILLVATVLQALTISLLIMNRQR